MIVKHTVAERRPSPFAPLLRRIWMRRIAAATGIVALVGASTLWGLYEGMLLYRNRVATELADVLDDVVATRLAIVPNWIAGWWAGDAKRLVLDIKHENFQKLAYQRELALERGVLISGADDEYVPARLGLRRPERQGQGAPQGRLGRPPHRPEVVLSRQGTR